MSSNLGVLRTKQEFAVKKGEKLIKIILIGAILIMSSKLLGIF